ncbi:MAG: PQQ-binding-like beta-propeller repeat protein [Salinirussus sp.]
MPSRRAVLGTAAGIFAGCVAAPTRRTQFDPLADRQTDTRAFAQFQGGIRNLGYVDREIPESVRVDWSIPVNRGDHTAAKSSPMPLPSGDIVVCGDTGRIRRIAPDGTVRWTTAVEPTARGIHGTPAIANGALYVGAYDGALYAFDLADGKRLWRRPLGDAIGSSPTYLAGVVYIAVEYVMPPSGSVAAVDAATGRQLWGDDRPTDHPHSTIGIDRDADRLVVGSNDGRVYAWTFPGLERAWSFETGGPIKAPIAVWNGLAIFGSWDNTIYGVDLKDGREVWSYETGGAVMTAPAIDPGGTAYIGSQDGAVYALSADTGESLWAYDTDGWLIGALTATPRHVLVGSYTDRLYAVNDTTARPTWTIEGVGYPTSAPLIAQDAIYYTERATGDDPGRCYRLVSR